MKNRSSISLLFVALLTVAAPAPAAASDLASFVIGLAIGAVEHTAEGIVNVVRKSAEKNESEEDRKVRENEQIEKVADDILAQYPEEEREARKPEVMMLLTKAKVQSLPVEDRLYKIKEEQNSVSAIVADTAKSAIGSSISSRGVFDSATRTAAFRARF